MAIYTYVDPDTGEAKDFILNSDHEPPRNKNGKPMVRKYKPVNFNLGRPYWKTEQEVAKWDQELIDYKEL